eukprot:CAMPEP_0171217144 /NCGR_PEP_ID=MMETSP0790-20130122/32537_1 /TAXON_ID=2925 /ORGANISM="Alexandrium catenella, Strain OF101" /LENGTH=72 /DNA_ID=CAMNT_0011682931 /DNA_START=32 /DNA_END=248 /DNA_ORIENTATION=+
MSAPATMEDDRELGHGANRTNERTAPGSGSPAAEPKEDPPGQQHPTAASTSGSGAASPAHRGGVGLVHALVE